MARKQQTIKVARSDRFMLTDAWVTNSYYAIRRPMAYGLFTGTDGDMVRTGQNGTKEQGSWDFTRVQDVSGLEKMATYSHDSVTRLAHLFTRDNDGNTLAIIADTNRGMVSAVRADWLDAISGVMPRGFSMTMASAYKPLAFWSADGDLLALIMPVRMSASETAETYRDDAQAIVYAYDVARENRKEQDAATVPAWSRVA